ncbi:MAG: hypothetical protein L6Q99_20225 [Planctomycetes bacterium]|nr:hypothetical protein [Planctomycetota bacterium]
MAGLCLAAVLACARSANDATTASPPNATTSPEVAPANESAQPGELPFTWPLPQDWRAETIPFPLGFAPSLSYRGLEELRFAPGMFDAAREDFWTYAFVWWLEGDVAFDASTLNADLATYFEGLSAAVEGPNFDAERAQVVAALEPATSSGAERAKWRGTVSSYDAFVTHARIDLRVEVEVFRCETRARTVAFFLISPQPAEHAVWKQLAEVRAAFACSPP